MSGKLTWIDFLNEATTWETQAQAELFWTQLLGPTCVLDSAHVKDLSDAESYMREQLNAHHFGRPIDFSYLNQILAGMRLQLTTTTGEPGESDNRLVLPALRATRKETNSTIQQIIDTWLFQFANFFGELIDGNAPYVVNRCAAIYRKTQVADCHSFYNKYRSLELSWREEVVSELPNHGELERCADFFVANQLGKFCSDACRFNSFALRKQTQSPNYQAEKQKRYRERQKSK